MSNARVGLVLGLDVGSVAAKGVILDAQGRVHGRALAALAGDARAAVMKVLRSLLPEPAGPVLVGVTGGGKGLLDQLPGVVGENDLVATARAVGVLLPLVRGVIEIGGHQSKWIRLGPDGQMESFALNDQCAAGSGAFLEQQAGRLRLDIRELSTLAASAERAASIAGRCAVFAKSDMIHLQQKGTPIPEIAYGLCVALVRNYRSTLLRGSELARPSVVLGGAALNPGLVRAVREVFGLSGDDLVETPEPQFLGARGVALAATERGSTLTPATILQFLERRAAATEKVGTSLQPLRATAADGRVEPETRGDREIRAYLGVDVGSVSTDLCLLSPEGEVLDGIYLRTRGDPVSVLREGLEILGRRTCGNLRVLGAGTTGSGRHLAGKLLSADVVKNEITCQLLGAKHALPEVDTILEIGGQDSKYVSVREGRIRDFVMNKICAAGTGSFLEEQGQSLGVSILDEFAAQALRGTVPTDLGSQCTVFMESEVVRARQRQIPLPDILAGLAYSVARNYLERVVAGRPIGTRVVFQGGVASNRAVVAAFEALLGRPVTVHPNNRLSGAIGAALAARDELAGRPSSFRGLDAVKSARVDTFECRVCANLCQVGRVHTGGGVACFGDICERHSVRGGAAPSSGQPDLVREVEQRMESYAGGEPRTGTAGIPRSSMMYDLFPFWATFLRGLGFRVVLPGPSTHAILESGIRRLTAETCLPIKLTFGHVAELLDAHPDVDFVFLPSIQDLPDGEARAAMCPFEESAGFMVAAFAGERVVVPTVHLAAPRPRLVREIEDKLHRYGFSEAQVSAALDQAWEAQRGYQSALRARGREILSGNFDTAFVLLGKPYNIVDQFQNLHLPQRIRNLGILAIPQQMLPLAADDLGALGITIPWIYNRDTLRGLRTVLRDERLFPVMVSNFGCGPDAFAMKLVERAAGDRPYLYLEFDEHRAEAGLVTRLEAFADEVAHHRRTQPKEPARFHRPPDRAGERYRGRRIVLPWFSDHAWAYLGALRFAGLDALLLPPPDDETLACGEEISSGRECHPYVLIAGDLLKHLRNGTIRDGDVYFFPGTSTPCLLHQYASSIQLMLDAQDISGIEVLSPDSAGYLDVFGAGGLVRLGRGLLAADLMTKLQCQVRPYAQKPADVDRVFERAFADLGAKLAEDRIGDALSALTVALAAVPRSEQPRRPLVGVAGDIYTRIHPFGNRDLFRRLEALGLEIWPAPFVLDIVEFGWRREMSERFGEGRYKDAAETALLFLRKELESRRIRRMLGTGIERASEPGYSDILALAEPYVDPGANEIVILNVARMVDCARRGAHGIINAISFHCMLGTVSAALTERIRADHGHLPVMTLSFSGKDSPEIDTKLEAFAHQVRTFAAAREAAREPRTWFQSLWH